MEKKRRTERITLVVTKEEREAILSYAEKNGEMYSSLIRKIVLREIKKDKR